MMRKVAWTILIAALTTSWAFAEDSGLNVDLGKLNMLDDAATAKTSKTAEEAGIQASEVLPGNGTRAGYVLGHGSIIAGSEWVYIGVHRARRNTDYTVDYSSGSLFFTEPVRISDSVKVDYRYSASSKGERSVTGPAGMLLKFSNSTQANLTYSYRAADQDQKAGSPDILTYGFGTTTKIGASSSISSLMYVATPQQTNRLTISTQTQNASTSATTAKTVKKDRIMVQNADMGTGKVRVKLGYQDVGEDFAGFTSLRESNAAAGDVLSRLEKEKGIKRMAVGTSIATGAKTGFDFSREQIQDKKDNIISQSFGYSGAGFTFGFTSRDVGKDFTRFKDLKEADRGQMAAEVGAKRTGYAMQLKTGNAANKPVWSSFGMNTIQSETGEMSYRSADVEVGPVKVQADVRTMDASFNRMGALNDAERTRMALIARRQFDPKAQVSQIVADDKTKFNNEAGINRENFSAQLDAGPVWLSLTTNSANTDNGGLNRRGIGIEHKYFTLYMNHQKIDGGFDRLSSLQSVEQARFGNEKGMTRTETGGTFKLRFGDVAVGHANVVDQLGAAVRRDSFGFKNSRLKFHANWQDIAPEFSRLLDLSDSDKKMLVEERGFTRSDYSIDLQATKQLNVKSYFYDSTNVTADKTRSQRKHEISYTLSNGLKVTGLMDDNSYLSETGNLAAYSRRRITFDNTFKAFGGLLFKGLNDVNTTQDANGDPVATEVTQTHVESNQNARTSYTIDSLQSDLGKGRFEDTWAAGVKTQPMKKLGLFGSLARTSREADKSETNATCGVNWAIRKDLNMAAGVANRDGGPSGSQQSTKFSLNGLLARKFLLLDNVRIQSGANTTQLQGKQTSCDNAMKVDAGLMKGKVVFDNSDKLNPKNGIYYTSRILQYESDKDEKKWYHVTCFRQHLVTPSGQPASKRNIAGDFKLSPKVGLTVTAYDGKDGKDGAVLPLGGTVCKLNYTFSKNHSFFADYTADTNEATLRRARIAGVGWVGTLRNKAAVELYVGASVMSESGLGDHDTVFRVKYDHKISAAQYISLSAQRRSAVERSAINPYEGATTAHLDLNIQFH